MCVSPVRGGQAWETQGLYISWDCPEGYGLCPLALIPQVIKKDDHLQVQNHHDCTRVVTDILLWDQVDLSTKSPFENCPCGGSC